MKRESMNTFQVQISNIENEIINQSSIREEWVIEKNERNHREKNFLEQSCGTF